MPDKFYVYSHWTADTHEIFYIGKSCDNRAFQKTKRNKWWKSIVKSHGGFIVDFFIENITDEKAKELESKLISDIGRRDQNRGPLVNMTDGGEGRKGFKISEETREKMRIAQKGKKLSNEHKKRLSEANTGKQLTDETKKKIQQALTGKIKNRGYKLSEEHKNKIKEKLSNRKLTDEHKQKLRESSQKNWNSRRSIV